jgi:hypothetical protein
MRPPYPGGPEGLHASAAGKDRVRALPVSHTSRREPGMRGLRSLIFIVYIVVGVVVASNHHYLTNLDSVRRVVSALLAIILWPLVILGVNLHIRK